MAGATLLTWLALVAPAGATVPDKYGAGARSMGSGGGGVAMVEDGNAALVNPAGLGRIRRPTASIGLSGVTERFRDLPDLWWDTNRDGVLDDRDDPLPFSSDVPDATGFSLTAGRNVGGKFGMGLYAYFPPQRIIRIETFEPDLPNYFMYGDRQQRYVLAAGVGGELVRGVNVGAAIDFVPRAKMDVFLTVDAEVVGDGQGDPDALTGDIRVDVHELRLDIVPAFAPVLGLQLELGRWYAPLDGLVIGAAFHGQVGVPIDVDLDLQANVALTDFGDLDPYVLPVILESGLSLYDHYVPARLSLGIAYRTDETLTAYLDVRWTAWRGMRLNIARIVDPDLTSPLVDVDDAFVDGNEHTATFRDTWSVRAGSELRLPRWEWKGRLQYLRLTVRGGFGIEPTPLVSQGDNSAFLDATRTFFTLGVGGEVWDPTGLVNGPVRLDAFVQYHVLGRGDLPRATTEPRAGYPVSATSLPVGGHLLVGGVQWGFDY